MRHSKTSAIQVIRWLSGHQWIGVLLLGLIPTLIFAQRTEVDRIKATADSLKDAGLYAAAIEQYKDFIRDESGGRIENAELEAESMENIAMCYFQLDQYTEAIEWFLKALEIRKETGDLESAANALNNIGLNYKMLGNYDMAVKYFEQTIQIDEQLGKSNEIAKTLNNIGLVYRNWGKYDRAIDYFDRSLRLRTSLDDQEGVSKTLNNIGLVYTEWKKYDQAIRSFRESLLLEQTLKDESEIAIRLNNLGRVYYFKNQHDTALHYFEQTLQIHLENQDQDQIALTYNNIGKVYLSLKSFDKAEEYLLAALRIYNLLGKEVEKATVLANLGDIMQAKGNLAKALQNLDSSTAIAVKLNLRSRLQQNYLSYSLIHEELSDYRQSLDYYKKYSEVKDSVFTDEILNQLSDFQIKYETEKKENEIRLLKQNEVIQNLALKKETVFRNSMIAVAALLLALAAMIFYSLQLKKKDNRIIAVARKKSDQLLLNILPAGIANDLKEKGMTEPQVFSNVTACFVDIVNFTTKAAALEPKTLINELNEIFTAFDNIIEKHQCERIKTIGDSYMAVAGLPQPNSRHAFHIVTCGIEMIRYMQKRNLNSRHQWEIRIGVHSGEVIAGVVGVKKYIYDVFGDTINTASRMESISEPMKINISQSTFDLIRDEFDTEFRGELEVKGKGMLRTYFVKA